MRNPQVFAERLVEVLTTRMWKKGNYFYYGYIRRRVFAEVLPAYLEKKNFKVLKERTDRVELFHGTWADAGREGRPGFWYKLPPCLIPWIGCRDQMIAENILKVVTGLDKERGKFIGMFW